MKRTVKKWLAAATIMVSIAILVAGCSAKPVLPSDIQAQVKKLEADKAALQAEVDKLKGATRARQLKIQTFQPAGSVSARSFEKNFGDVIRDQTGGQLQAKLFPDNGLVPEGELFEAVRKGVVDLAMTSPGRDAGMIGPAGDIILGLPFMWKTMDESRTLFYDRGIGEITRNLYGQRNIHVVGPAGSSGLDVSLFSKTPVRTLDDLKGMKVRLSGGRAAGDLFAKFGAVLVPSGMGEVYTNLGTGVIAGASSDLTSGMAFAWHEVAKYVMQPPYITNYTVLLIANTDVWKSLTDS